MIVHLCDYCGAETTRGDSIPDQGIKVDVNLTPRWQNGHTTTRASRVRVLIGIDGINPEPDHEGHDLCTECQIRHLKALIRLLRGESA